MVVECGAGSQPSNLASAADKPLRIPHLLVALNAEFRDIKATFDMGLLWFLFRHTTNGIRLLQTYLVNTRLGIAEVYSDNIVNPAMTPVDVAARAAQTTLTDGAAFWGIFDSGNMLGIDMNPDPSINVNLALSISSHNLQISAYNNSFIASMVTFPEVSSSSGVLVAWQARIYTDQSEQYPACGLRINSSVTPSAGGVPLGLSVHFKATG